MGPRTKRQRTSKVPMSAIPRQLVPETKYQNLTGNQLTTSFVTSSMVVSQGNGRAERVGNKVFMKGLDISFAFGAGTTPANARLSVLVPKDPSIAPAALNPLLRYSQDDFHILFDELYSSVDSRSGRVKLPLNRLQTYNGALSSNILSNNVYVVVNSPTSEPEFSVRYYFTDA